MSTIEPVKALNLDISQQQTFVRYFENLPEKPLATVRIFNRNDYYTVHGEDTAFASEFTSNPIKFMGKEPKLSYTTLNRAHFESFIRELLLVRQYRVEVYENTKTNDWHLEYKGSPGNLAQFEEILFENATISFSNSVMGVQIIKTGLSAIGCVNTTEVKMQVCELNDNECFSELEALLAQISPKECVIPVGETPELIALQKVLDRNGILVAKVKKSEFNSEDVIQDLNRLLLFHEGQKRDANGFKETALKGAIGSLQAIIKFLNLTGDQRNFNQFNLSKIDAHRFVRLDNAALYALNALPKLGANSAEGSVLLPNDSKSFTILGVLDSCVTTQGHRLLEQWIKQPLLDLNLINERLDIVECFMKDPESRRLLGQDCLSGVPDLLILSKKLSSKKASLQDCYRVYQTIGSIPNLISVLGKVNNKCVKSMLIDPISEVMVDLEKYQGMIEEILDLNLVKRGQYFVKNTFDEELNELYKKKERIEEKMQKLLHNAARDLDFDESKIKLEYTEQHGYFFRVTMKEEQALRQSKSYKIIDAIKGGVRFSNKELTNLNADYSEVKDDYEKQQKTVVAEVFDVAAGYADSLRTLNLYLATIDVFVSFANAAVNARIPYVRPKLLPAGSGKLKLDKVRHPCLEQQDHIAFIPNDVAFDSNNKTLHIITGPNMCGKSTYIRSVGVCVLMAHIGSFVPCDSAEVSIVDGIFARVGAEDCQLKGLSTFMLEMIETSTIIRSATTNSLVIIDELGRGTSTYDGCGIAWAIAENLAKEVKCFSLFATHYHEITRLAETCPSVDNLHVTAVTTNDTITPLYQIRAGECDKSYGIHCARMVGFPEDVVQWAINHQQELEHHEGTKFISDLRHSEKRKVIEEGKEMIAETLEKVKSLDLSKISDKELQDLLNGLKTGLESKDNLFIKGLLVSGT